MRAFLLLAPALLFSSAAMAHTGVGGGAGLAYGFAHPLGGLDHVLAMVAVGVFAFVLGGRALILVPLAFVGAMLAGFAIGLGQVDLPFVELGIALSSIAIGGAAALGRSVPTSLAAALVGGFGVFHGHAHGAEMPAAEGAIAYALGFVLATVLLLGAGVVGSGGMARFAHRGGKVLARWVGGLLALLGAGVLAGWL